MNVTEIVQQLREERRKLDAAIQALEGVSDNGASAPAKRRGRPRGSSNKPSTATAAGAPTKRRMSPAARKRIAESMRRRWAAAKRSGKGRARLHGLKVWCEKCVPVLPPGSSLWSHLR